MKLLLDVNFRFGFELEYQSDKLGYRLCEIEKQRIIEIRYRNLLSNNTQLTLLHRSLYDKVYLALHEKLSKEHEISWPIACIITNFKDLGVEPTASNIAIKLLSNMNTGKLINLYPDLVPIIKEGLALTIRKYEYEIKDLQLHPALERVNDGSVDGGEIRPIHKQTLDNSIALLQSLEQAYDFRKDMKVDIECSFHIHISNTGIKHSYGENFQRYMYEYLYHNMSKLPNNILQRFLHVQDNDNYDEDEDEVTNWCDEYYTPEISQNRYNAIAFRESLGTWEFRFFGNISNANEGILCLNFAKDCYIYAYNKVHIDKEICKFGIKSAHAVGGLLPADRREAERVCSSIKGQARFLTEQCGDRGMEDVVQPSIFTYIDEPVEPITLSEVTSGVSSPRILMPEGVILDGRIDYRLFEPRGYQSTNLCEALGLVQANAPTNTHTVTLDEAMTLFPANAPDLPQPRETLAEATRREFYRIMAECHPEIVDNSSDRTGT